MLWRFKFLVIGGFVLATLLATVSMANVTFAHGKPVFTYRQSLVWAAQETLLITQPGFLEGRVTLPPTADPGRLTSLSLFYAQLANSDAVQSQIPLIRKNKPLPFVTITPVTSYVGGNASLLPILNVAGNARTSKGAIRVTRAASEAFRAYLAQRQVKASIPDGQRVVISVLNLPTKAIVVEPRKKTIPLMVFVAVLAATVVLAVILENVRPRALAVRPAPMENLAGQRKVRSPSADVRRSSARR